MSWLRANSNGNFFTNLTLQWYGLDGSQAPNLLLTEMFKIHVQQLSHSSEGARGNTTHEIATECSKLMHRIKEDQLEALLDEAEGPS